MTGGIEDLLRDLAPRVLAVLARRYGDFDAAEDAVQEALITAAGHWAAHGAPENSRAWLITTASRKFVDQVRNDQARARRESRAAALEPPTGEPPPDDTLTVLFLCCHPALTPASAIGLTLRAVAGLTTAEIARAFLVPEATMAQRISRAKKIIRDGGAHFRMPTPEEFPARLRSVLHVLYLMFNEGYVSSGGDRLHRPDLAGEAIRLARTVHRLLPRDGETAGLLALMLLTDARRAARTAPDGELVPLDEQDRTRWDHARIAEGTAILDRAVRRGDRPGEYRLQAAIAALHGRAATAAQTDWPQILALYGLLERLTDNPVVVLNKAVAQAMVHGPAAGLALLAGVELARVDAVRAHLYEMAGDLDAAVHHYRTAAARATTTPERRYLMMRAARIHGDR